MDNPDDDFLTEDQMEIMRLRQQYEALDHNFDAVCKVIGHSRALSRPASETARDMREALKAAEDGISTVMPEYSTHRRRIDTTDNALRKLNDALAKIKAVLGKETPGAV